MPRVSVIISTHNRAGLLGEAIESVLSQTYNDLELFVVDDGSTDNTEVIVSSFADPRLHYIKQSNQGVSAAFRTGIHASSGEFLSILADDDLFLPEKLALQVGVMDRDQTVGLVYGMYYSAVGTESPEPLITGPSPRRLGVRDLLLGVWPHWSTILVRRSWIDQVDGFDRQFPISPEWDLELKLAIAGCGIIGIKEPVSIIRQQPGSLGKDLHQRERVLRAVLDKAFDDPGMPAEGREVKQKAYALQLAVLAGLAYLQPQRLTTGRDFLQRALEAEPTFKLDAIDLWVHTIIDQTIGLCLTDPQHTLKQIVSCLPGDRSLQKRMRRRLQARFYEVMAFRFYRLQDRHQCLISALRAIANNPSYLKNRGLISIFLRSLVGFTFFGSPETAGATQSQ